MHTLDGSKDVQGARREPKGRLGQNVLAAGLPRFVLGINSKLIEINSNRRLSRTVRNLASTNIVVTMIWNMMVWMNMELLHRLWLLLYATK